MRKTVLRAADEARAGWLQFHVVTHVFKCSLNGMETLPTQPAGKTKWHNTVMMNLGSGTCKHMRLADLPYMALCNARRGKCCKAPRAGISYGRNRPRID